MQRAAETNVPGERLRNHRPPVSPIADGYGKAHTAGRCSTRPVRRGITTRSLTPGAGRTASTRPRLGSRETRMRSPRVPGPPCRGTTVRTSSAAQPPLPRSPGPCLPLARRGPQPACPCRPWHCRRFPSACLDLLGLRLCLTHDDSVLHFKFSSQQGFSDLSRISTRV